MFKRLFILILVSPFIINAQNIDSTDFIKTKTLPYIQAEISFNSNIIYCSTFQMAWNKFKNDLGGVILLSGNPILAEYLNNGVNENSVNSQNCLVVSGIATESFINKTNKQIKSKFKSVFNLIEDKPDSNVYLAYAFLYKNLLFKKRFEEIKSGLVFNEFFNDTIIRTKVKAFGINLYSDNNSYHKGLIKQTKIYIKSNNQFVVKLFPERTKDEIILAQISPKKTIIESYDEIMSLINNTVPLSDYKKVRLYIPNISINIVQRFDELIDQRIQNEKYNGWRLSEAMQSLKFCLDEKGAIVESVAKIRAYRSIGYKDDSRIIQFNEPYFIILKEEDKKYPYLILWIANSELMKEYI